MDPEREALFQRFIQHGFEGLVDDQSAVLAKWLSERAAQTNRTSLAFVSDAIDAVYALFLEHDEYGGIRLGFIRQLDEVVYSRLPLSRRRILAGRQSSPKIFVMKYWAWSASTIRDKTTSDDGYP